MAHIIDIYVKFVIKIPFSCRNWKSILLVGTMVIGWKIANNINNNSFDQTNITTKCIQRSIECHQKGRPFPFRFDTNSNISPHHHYQLLLSIVPCSFIYTAQIQTELRGYIEWIIYQFTPVCDHSIPFPLLAFAILRSSHLQFSALHTDSIHWYERVVFHQSLYFVLVSHMSKWGKKNERKTCTLKWSHWNIYGFKFLVLFLPK